MVGVLLSAGMAVLVAEMTKEEYERLKHAYHVAGKRARGTKAGSQEQKDYEAAKRAYHRAGEELQRARNRN